MKKRFSLAVYIGRFQPVHLGHLANIRRGLDVAEHVLVLIGSSGESQSPRNPFDSDTRAELLRIALTEKFPVEDASRVTCDYIRDHVYNDAAWVVDVITAINRSPNCPATSNEIAIIGHKKDATSFYLDYFPQYSFIGVDPFVVGGVTVSSTILRERFFESGYWCDVPELIPVSVTEWLRKKINIHPMIEEWRFIKEYQKSWANSPYPPTFVTTDAVVIQSGHILLIQRKNAPGRGLWALPGGFLKVGERIEDSVIRELREETRLKVPEKVLRGSIKRRGVFDDVNRSQRGRTITHAFLFHLDDSAPLPKVKGSDDARRAKWFPFGDLTGMTRQIFEDHYHIAMNLAVFGGDL